MRQLILLLAISLIAACNAGCQALFGTGTSDLYDQATTPVQHAKAVLLHHNALGATMAGIIEDPAVSANTKDSLRSAYRKTVCSSDEISIGTKTEDCDDGPRYKASQATSAYEALQSAKNQAELQAAIAQLLPLITALLNITNEVQQ